MTGTCAHGRSRTVPTELRCTVCGGAHALDVRYRCPSCGGILDVEYAYGPHPLAWWRERAQQRDAGMWAFRDLLPLSAATEAVTLGEGWTPLLPARHVEAHTPGAGAVHFKLESTNPTASFKDRPIAVAVTKATEMGASGVITASSGNAGAAMSAYAARAGLPSITLVPHGVPASKLAQIASHGTRIVAVDGNFSGALALARAFARKAGWYDVTSTFASAFPTEGDKTVAYELVLQMGSVPDWILVPVGSGPLLVGALKGFRELRRFGVIDRLPRMVAVQASGCAPVARAFQGGRSVVEAWDAPETIASGIRDPLQGYPEDGTRTLACVRESRGVVVEVDDAEILESRRYLAAHEGVLAEPTGAVGMAGLRALVERGVILEEHRAVVLVTGHGLKEAPEPGDAANAPKVVEADLASLEAALG